jgi:hypothetical protein
MIGFCFCCPTPPIVVFAPPRPPPPPCVWAVCPLLCVGVHRHATHAWLGVRAAATEFVLCYRTDTPAVSHTPCAVYRVQVMFENVSPSYLAALEDKGLFGTRGAKKAGGGPLATPSIPLMVQVQATRYVHGAAAPSRLTNVQRSSLGLARILLGCVFCRFGGRTISVQPGAVAAPESSRDAKPQPRAIPPHLAQ